MNDPTEMPVAGGGVPRAYGPWTILAEREVYRDPWTCLHRHEVRRPDGNPGTYSVVHLKPGVCAIALDDDERVHLTEEFHYAVGRVTLEGVSGGVEPDELLEVGARRELREELGITAERWLDLGRVDPFTASVLCPTQLFLARGLTFGMPELEGTETIRRATFPLSEAVAMVWNGRITHAPTCVGLLKTWCLLRGMLPAGTELR